MMSRDSRPVRHGEAYMLLGAHCMCPHHHLGHVVICLHARMPLSQHAHNQHLDVLVISVAQPDGDL